ncbi:hypothetical protein [Pseudonocardia sp. HH130630-07]|uniref:hypothetical protein n=1 Tax=Pseudonocardia sp. HH130630-07 TaxID=1690815 RepID=UPI000814CBA9|nr:hypothetical protein [Pseudonocardia sp. HH130630-07]ANY10693.1 hypothetical protein AFB00_30265 [Pseudonocardia sp. HH130630-07]
MVAPLELIPRARLDPASYARAQAAAFAGHRLRIGHSRVVHDVTWRDWLGDLQLPVPACHQSWSGLATTGDLSATTDPANCRKCTARNPATTTAVAGQTTLFEPPAPRPTSTSETP